MPKVNLAEMFGICEKKDKVITSEDGFFPGDTVWYISKEVSISKNYRISEKRTPTSVILAEGTVTSIEVSFGFDEKRRCDILCESVKVYPSTFIKVADGLDGEIHELVEMSPILGRCTFSDAVEMYKVRVENTTCVPGVNCFHDEDAAKKALFFFKQFGLKIHQFGIKVADATDIEVTAERIAKFSANLKENYNEKF